MHTMVFADLLGSFGINLLAFISQLISFGIVFLILWRWGFPAIQGTLAKRQQVIREGVENAEKATRDLKEASTQAEQNSARGATKGSGNYCPGNQSGRTRIRPYPGGSAGTPAPDGRTAGCAYSTGSSAGA